MRLSAALVMALITFTQSSRQIIRTGPDPGLPFSPAVKADGLIYVSGTLGTDAQNQIVKGGIAPQTRQVLDNIGATLKAGGSSLSRAASVMVYLRSADDFAAMNEVYRSYWPKEPPARTTLMVTAPLALPDALIEISMVAVPDQAERLVVHPADWIQSPNPYSYGIKSGNTLFLAGLISRNGKDNSVVKGDMAAQTRTALDNGAAILKAAGMSYADVASARVFITDPTGFAEMNTVYRSYFAGSLPARATVKAGLMGADYLVEITMIAVKDASRTAVNPPNGPTPAAVAPNLSPAIRVGNRLYVSGMLGATAANTDVRSQTTETLTRIGNTLKAAGFSWTDVVDGVVYLPNMARFAEMNAAYREVFAKDFPARATVGVGLINPDGLVEIMMTAAK